tara:strand:- start:29835 stop:30944 length:1110 start_codon:yes stop_codon:yes gene_type:complete
MVLAGITAARLYFAYVPMYQSSHILEVNQDYVVFKGVMPGIEDLVKTESQLIYNSLVLDPVLSKPGIAKTPELSDPKTAVANLESHLSIGNAGTKQLLVISYESRDPDSAAIVCNTVVDYYLRVRDRFDQARVSSFEHWLTPEIQRREQEVVFHQQHVARLSERVFGYDVNEPGAKDVFDDRWAMVRRLCNRRNELSLKIEILDAQIAINDSTEREAPDPDQEPRSVVLPEPLVEKLVRKRQLLSAELPIVISRCEREKARLAEFGGDVSELQFARDEMEVANGVLSKLRDRIAAIRTERRRDGRIRSIAAAVPPQQPMDSLPTRRIAALSLAAFLAPFLVGYLLGYGTRRPAAVTDDSSEPGLESALT